MHVTKNGNNFLLSTTQKKGIVNPCGSRVIGGAGRG